jgi:hypothetical protein
MLPLILGIAGMGMQAAGMGESARASRRAARAERAAAKKAREAAEFTAEQYKGKAQQERAIGSREVEQQARKGKIAVSNARAIGAASGAGGYESNIAEIIGESDYQMLAALYNGEQTARDFDVAAEVSLREGADAARAHAAQAGSYRSQNRANMFQGAASFANSAMTLYERYGQSYQPEATAAA